MAKRNASGDDRPTLSVEFNYVIQGGKGKGIAIKVDKYGISLNVELLRGGDVFKIEKVNIQTHLLDKFRQLGGFYRPGNHIVRETGLKEYGDPSPRGGEGKRYKQDKGKNLSPLKQANHLPIYDDIL